MQGSPPSLGRSVAWVASAGLAWALLCGWLAVEGHAPSVTLIPIPRESYYAAQAVFAAPLILAQFALLGALTHRVARALGGSSSLRDTYTALGPAFASPIILLIVIPDVIVLTTAGFAALGSLVRVTAPLLALTTWVTVTVAVRRVCALSAGRAALAAVVGLVAQAALGAPFLR